MIIMPFQPPKSWKNIDGLKGQEHLLVSDVMEIVDAQTMMDVFIRSLCQLFPSSALQHLKHDVAVLHNLSYKVVVDSVCRPHFISSPVSWEEQFVWGFPLSKDCMQFGRNTQGWRQLDYWDSSFNSVVTGMAAKRRQL